MKNRAQEKSVSGARIVRTGNGNKEADVSSPISPNIASLAPLDDVSTGLPSSVCVVCCAVIMAVSVYQTSKIKDSI